MKDLPRQGYTVATIAVEVLLRRSLSALAAVALAACAPDMTAPTQEPAVAMRTWSMAPERARAVVATLNRVLPAGGGAPMRATEGPNGTVVVVAPEAVLDGVEDLVREAEQRAAPAKLIEVDYWLVTAGPGEGARGPGLAQLEDVLDLVESTYGAGAFTLEFATSLRSLEGQSAHLRVPRVPDARGLGVAQTLSIEPRTSTVVAHVDLDIRLDQASTDVSTAVTVGSGDYAVISQSGADGVEHFVIIRPTILP